MASRMLYIYVGGTVVVTHAEQPQGDDVESDLRRKKSARVKMAPMCLRWDASFDMQQHRPWPRVKFWNWPYYVEVSRYLCVLMKETRWRQTFCSISHRFEVILENVLWRKWPILQLTYEPKVLTLGQFWWCQLKSYSFKSFRFISLVSF